MNKKRVLVIPADNFACGFYRIYQPYQALQKVNSEIQFDIFDVNRPPVNSIELAAELAQYEAVLFQRVSSSGLLAVMDAVKRAGKKVIMEFDDDLLGVDHKNVAFRVWNPVSGPTKIFKKALALADHLHVSTPELKDKYKQYNSNIHVFKNCLEISDNKFNVNRRWEMPDDKIVVGWAGSTSHVGSMKMISKELKQVFDNRPNAVFALCGNEEFIKMFNIKDEQKIYVPHVPFADFYSIPSMFDISLAPVEISSFNQCKSELKCLESGIFGVPSICTSIAPYRRFNEVSNDGNWLVKSNERRNWLDALYNLIDDEKLRKEMGYKTQQTVLSHYDISDENEKRLAFYREILS